MECAWTRTYTLKPICTPHRFAASASRMSNARVPRTGGLSFLLSINSFSFETNLGSNVGPFSVPFPKGPQHRLTP